jgi:mutator protein MutT
VYRTFEVAVVLIVHAEKVLVLRRRPEDRSFASMWCLPGGRLEHGESPERAAVREVEEETGLSVELVAALGPRRIHLPEREIVFRVHRYVGRTTRSAVSLSDEHVEARWIDRDEAARAGAVLPSGIAGEITAALLERFAARRELSP